MKVGQFALVAASLSLGSCGSVEVPETSYYRLRLPQKASGALVPAGVLAVRDVNLVAGLANDRLMVSDGEVRSRYFHYHRWSGPLDRLLADTLHTGIARSGCFRDVRGDALGPDVDFVLDARVHEFHLAPDEARGWCGHAAVEFRLSTIDGQLVSKRELECRSPASDRTPEAAVLALSASVDGLIDEWLATCEQLQMFDRSPAAKPGR